MVREILKYIKIKINLFHLRHEIFFKLFALTKLVAYTVSTFTFRYSLAYM